jgi:hypothetical protein
VRTLPLDSCFEATGERTPAVRILLFRSQRRCVPYTVDVTAVKPMVPPCSFVVFLVCARGAFPIVSTASRCSVDFRRNSKGTWHDGKTESVRRATERLLAANKMMMPRIARATSYDASRRALRDHLV